MSNNQFNQLPQRGAALMGALADPTRKKIFNLLLEKPLVVKVITADLPISQSAVSQHLKVMREAGLVLEEKQGRTHLYSANPVALDWLSWQFGMLRDDVLSVNDEKPSSDEYDDADMVMEQWQEQWPELDTVTNGVMMRLFLIGRHLDFLFERLAGRFGYSAEQVLLMSTIDRVPQGECSLTLLAKINFSQIAVTEAHITPMVQDGLLEKQDVDEATTIVTLTDKGRETLHKILTIQRFSDHSPIYKMQLEDRLKLAKLLRPLLADIRKSIREGNF